MSDSESSDVTQEVKDKIKALPAKDRVRAVALFHHWQKKKVLDDALEGKSQVLQRQYDNLSLPIYKKQNEIILGQRAPTVEELKDHEKYVNDTEKQQIQELLTSEPIQDYWLKALKTSQLLADICQENEKDWDVLKSLQSVSIEYPNEGKDDFRLKFQFAANEYFTNEVLSKEINFNDKNEPKKSKGTVIEWKDGKNITVKKVTKKQKNKKTGATRAVTKDVDAESFFNFFKDFDVTDQNEEEEEQQKQEGLLDEHMEIAQEFLEQIIPYSVELYMGLQPEVHQVDDDDEDVDDDDDDESDDDKKKKRKKSSDSKGDKKGGDKKDPKQAAQPECKQQ